ncbi:hypothetical protein KCV07_g8427, partial [Aureobasidium melanogenum]
MVEFLKRAYSTELPETELLHNGTSTEYKFFYFLEGLVGPHGHETPAYNYDDFEDYPGQYMTLYTPNDRLGSHPFGLVYDQETHECVINFANIWFEPTDRALPWQRLETVLSVYIDMVESEKVVCIRDDVEQSGDIKRVVVDGDIKWLDTRDRPDAILADPVTGVKRNRGVMFGPWIVQPYTKAMLERCLQIWDSLVQAIEDRIPRPPDNDTIVEYGLANEQMLDLAGVTEEFTKQILLRARRPRFTFIAPGLRLPTLEEFTEQPFKGIMTMQNDPQTRQTMPTLILRGDNSCKASTHFPHPYEGATSVPTGLYLADSATKALEAKHGVFLSGRTLHCEFGSESSLNDQVEIPMIVSEQPTDDHKDDESSISEEIVVIEQFGRPSKFLHVVGIAKSVDIERLFKEFADVSPVNINFGASKRIAFIEFTDVEAATKAIKAKHGTFLCGTTVGTVAQVPEEIMKQSVGKAPIDITAGTVKYAPTQTIPDELMLSSKPDSLDQTTSLRKVTKRQRKNQKAKAAQSMIKEPAPSSETRLDKSVFETSSESIKDQAETTTVEPPGATSDDEALYDGGVYNASVSSSSKDQATFHDLEKDDLVYEDEPSSSDELQSKAYQELSRQYGLKKGPLVDRVLPEIRQYATIPVPRTRAYYLPYSSQNRVLSGLQASLEQVCFRYLQRKHHELLEETPTRWAIDSAHAFELNRYIYLLGRLIASNPAVDLGPGGSQSLQALIESIAGLRHHAVHRFRVDIEALRFWAVDAVRLAELLDDSEAAKQFSSLVSSLEAQQNRMKAEKMKAEGDLLVTVRELAAKRAELLRVEREAMTAYEVAHKQLPTRTSELDKVIDANIPLGHGFGVEWKETTSVEGTSSAKPASGIFGRIKSWFGA